MYNSDFDKILHSSTLKDESVVGLLYDSICPTIQTHLLLVYSLNCLIESSFSFNKIHKRPTDLIDLSDISIDEGNEKLSFAYLQRKRRKEQRSFE